MSAILKLSRNLSACGSCFQKRLQHVLSKVNLQSISSAVSNDDVVPIFRNAVQFADRPAVKDNNGNYTYANLFMSAKEVAQDISKLADNKQNQRVIFLCPNDARYVITQWAIWMSGQIGIISLTLMFYLVYNAQRFLIIIAVPVHHNQPEPVLEYYCNDSNASLLVTTVEYAEVMQSVAKKANKKLLVLDDNLRQNAARNIPKRNEDLEAGLPPDFYLNNNAMILYTSGTTGQPKGNYNLFFSVVAIGISI